jgi:outer membrane assembly lipoprotein YfgL
LLVASATFAAVTLLSGCSWLQSIPFIGSGGGEKAKPAELTPNPATIGVRQAWTARVGQVGFSLSVNTAGGQVAVASDDGTVAVIDPATGRDVWRMSVGAPLASGVGSDGSTLAVVTRSNDLVALSGGKQLWKQKLPAVAYTAPFVAGGRVFVLGADRAVSAYDGQTGRKLWTQQRAGEPLVLRHAGVMLAVGDTLVVGLSGRLAGLNPLNGTVRWESPIASPRGINDVERLVDLVGTVSRIGNNVCARAFQASVGCADAARGALLWTKPANGAEGVSGDEQRVYGTEADGKVVAWKRENGERAWASELLMHRGLSAPLVLGRSVIVGDAQGYVHMLSREDGKLFNRLSTDGSAIAAAPVAAGNTLVVVTRNGGVFGFTPE